MTQIQIPDKVYADITKACDTIGQSGQGAEELGYALDRLTAAVMGETPQVAVWDHKAYMTAISNLKEQLAESERKLQDNKIALHEFLDKTEWVQQTCQGHELGMHRADVLKQRIENLQKDLSLTKGALSQAEYRNLELANLLDGLRDLCGYVENGSDTVVRISQDDATKDWVVTVGNHLRPQSAFGRTFGSAIKSAIEKFGGDHG